jgi:dolichyl-phosphate-mannose-protein mannosyltransferase
MPETQVDAPAPPSRRLVLGIILGLAAALWIFAALRQGLWLDEFHSLQHARQADLGSFFASVRNDNHPPLYFLFLRGARAVFGESHLALRLPSILAALGVVAILGRHSSRRALLAAGLFAVSSYALVIAVDARMYAQLALAVTGLWTAMEEGRRATPRPGFPRFMAGLWCVVGLHTHYFFFYFAFLAVVGLALDYWRRPAHRGLILRLAGAMALALVLFLPWFWWGMRHQLGHGLAPGRSHTEWHDWPLSILHFFFIDVGAGGRPALIATYAGLGVAGILALGAWVAAWRSPADLRRRVFETLSLALLAPLLAFTVAGAVERAGYNWKYIAGAAPLSMWLIVPVSAREGVWSKGRDFLLATLALCMISVSLWSALDRGREDYGAALRELRRSDVQEELIFASPAVFPDGARRLSPWRYYAEREGVDPARALSLDRFSETELTGRSVAVLMRGALPKWVEERLASTHHREAPLRFGADLSLNRFRPRAD